ncbi:MAG: hypothetical protein LBT86_00035 [Deltaproteobacteria bacterium]|jgi:lipopolysaccharide export system protein LptA|nr:hypothetical protein [Deltaproteobacteria bacterium]
MKPKNLLLAVWLALGVLWLAGLSFAAPSGENNPNNPIDTPRDGPISISADHMTANDNTKVVTFTGRVIARQDDMIITCETMKVHYQPRGKTQAIPAPPLSSSESLSSSDVATEDKKGPSASFSGGQEIERVVCEGSVKIQQGDRLAVGQKALYLARSKPRRLILTGDARVWQGRNAVTGHEVTYFLDENRSQVESQNNSRVRAFYERTPAPGSSK